jgi:hypothetical protein
MAPHDRPSSPSLRFLVFDPCPHYLRTVAFVSRRAGGLVALGKLLVRLLVDLCYVVGFLLSELMLIFRAVPMVVVGAFGAPFVLPYFVSPLPPLLFFIVHRYLLLDGVR